MQEILKEKYNKDLLSAYADVDGILSRLNDSVGEAVKAYFAVRLFKSEVPDDLNTVATILKQVFPNEVSVSVDASQKMLTIESSGNIASKELHDLYDEYHKWYQTIIE